MRPLLLGNCFDLEVTTCFVERRKDEVGVTTNRTILDVFLMLATAGIRVRVDSTGAMGAPILAAHNLFINPDESAASGRAAALDRERCDCQVCRAVAARVSNHKRGSNRYRR